jgi:uncharacterized RDD family membrane protein YckC
MSVADSTLPAPATRYPGVGPRAIATLIDSVLGFIVIGVPLLVAFGQKTITYTDAGTSTSYSTSNSWVFAVWLVLAIAYYVLFESTIGATPGKFVLGLRVRDEAGNKCTAKAALLRNVLRVVDAFPYVIPYLLGAIMIWEDDSSPAMADVRRRRRIGDRVAKAIVTYR